MSQEDNIEVNQNQSLDTFLAEYSASISSESSPQDRNSELRSNFDINFSDLSIFSITLEPEISQQSQTQIEMKEEYETGAEKRTLNLGLELERNQKEQRRQGKNEKSQIASSTSCSSIHVVKCPKCLLNENPEEMQENTENERLQLKIQELEEKLDEKEKTIAKLELELLQFYSQSSQFLQEKF